MKPTRPVLRWHGGKWRLAPWIISHFPPHRVYVEPFGGSAAVLLRKPPSVSEVWNDLDEGVVNVFRVLREKPEALQRALELTPYARADYASLYEPTADPVEFARRVITRSFIGQSSKGAVQKSGFDSRINPDGYFGRLNSLRAVAGEIPAIVSRMAAVMLEKAPALAILDRYDRPDTLFYLDPPYVPEARNSRSRVYAHEMDGEAHDALLTKLRALRGLVALSAYPSRRYEAGLTGWARFSTDAYTDSGKRSEEVLWLNPACADALDRQRRRRAAGEGTPLFSEVS